MKIPMKMKNCPFLLHLVQYQLNNSDGHNVFFLLTLWVIISTHIEPANKTFIAY